MRDKDRKKENQTDCISHIERYTDNKREGERERERDRGRERERERAREPDRYRESITRTTR